ncbi:rCG35682, isoform CRA_b [Rattus norvegicus]|uniref:RCG35682, isoform CRA_b n=1 Tax=Rattus norvegicus TaxID=10116 RepID=A6MGS6_RAT|nr:rCG35682, isoform CRA_b [Rattus norvegicus]
MNHSKCSCFIPGSARSPSSYPIKVLGSRKLCLPNHPVLNLTSYIEEIQNLTLPEEELELDTHQEESFLKNKLLSQESLMTNTLNENTT